MSITLRICKLSVARLAREFRIVFVLSKGNYYGIIVDGMRKRTDIKIL